MRDIGDLRQRQALPLQAKVYMSQARIREWYDHFDGNVCVSFSGGKDSTVLAHLVHDLYPEVPLVFANTGLEYPEIQSIARKMGAEFVKPKMKFTEVISKYGYPLITKQVSEAIYYARQIRETNDKTKQKETYYRRCDFTGQPYKRNQEIDTDRKGESFKWGKTKWLPLIQETEFKISHKCCSVMKKQPMHQYHRTTKRHPYIGTLAEESMMRTQAWIKNGCNAFESSSPISQPIAFWTEQDVLHYIKEQGIEIAKVYGEILAVNNDGFMYEPLPGVSCNLKCTGCQRTGCIFCGFGVHLDKDEKTKFQKLADTHPKQYEYCMGGGQWVDNPEYDPTAPKMDGDWLNWNPKQIWVPSKEGLGMKYVFDQCNQIYGKDFIRYE